MLRLAVYSIFDKYQQIHHEIGVEYEFDESEKALLADKLCQPVTSTSRLPCVSSSVCRVSIDAPRLETILSAMSNVVADFVAQHVDYVEKPMVKINVDWLEGMTSLSTIRMLSYTIPGEQVENESNFVDYMMTRLKYLINAAPGGRQHGHNCTYFLRRKLDGERLYATYDGGHGLCLSDGVHLDLRSVVFQEMDGDTDKGLYGATDDVHAAYRYLFSVDFVYQVERVNEHHYYFTEVVAVRHSYVTELSSLVHTFSPSRNFYRATDEQVWPYALIGNGLDNHATSSLVDFWLTSACGKTSGLLTRELIDTLQNDRPALATWQTDDESEVFPWVNAAHVDIDDDETARVGADADQQQKDMQSNTANALTPPSAFCAGEEEKAAGKAKCGLFAEALPSPGMSTVSDTAGSVATSAGEPFLKAVPCEAKKCQPRK